MRQIIAFGVLFCSFFAFAHKADSVGTKVKNGKVYILHKVEQGQGMYSISKRYGVPLKTLIDENPGSDKVIKTDHIIWVPTEAKPVLEEKVVTDYFENNDIVIKDRPEVVKEKTTTTTTEVSTFAKYHIVSPGETLYSISQKYKTSVEMIQTLNGLETTALSEGQKLLVQDGKATTKTVSVVDEDYEAVKEKLEEKKYEELGFDTVVETETKQSSSGYSIKVEKLVEYNIEKVEETGVGVIGGDGVPSDKNFAAHFNAPIGTVIMVTNPSNEKTVFIKVISNFVKSEESSTIIRLSEQSANQIGFSTNSKVLL
ncbi:MAG: LysM peptidoglycan-binding domain-containing protein, partial [Bacteroidia bacterium]|nr:LysM peptidoglycan-binding domain-containing protein [Bacteroidia bacterium]